MPEVCNQCQKTSSSGLSRCQPASAAIRDGILGSLGHGQRFLGCKALGETAIMALIGSVGDFAEGKPNYELAAEVQRQRIERLKKLRLQREAAQKTEAVVQPLVQRSDLTNLEAGPNNSAQRTSSRTEPERQKLNRRPCRNGLRDKSAGEAVTSRTRYVRSPEEVPSQPQR